MMDRYRFWRDPIWAGCVAAYVLNRWGLQPWLQGGFMQAHFNDLLLIPAALPLMLEVHGWMGWRESGRPPGMSEVVFHLVIWSLVCEGGGPWIFEQSTADWLDVAAYAAGGVLAWVWWWWIGARETGDCRLAGMPFRPGALLQSGLRETAR
jgi:hypothetical protein